MKPFYLLMLTAALACAGCCKDKSDNPPPQKLTVEQTDYTLGAFEERTATVSLSASADWTVSVVYDGADSEADAAWLAVTPANGAAGEQRLTLSADNNFRNAPRTARLDLACGGQTVQVAVTQSASGFDDTTDLTDFFDPQFAQDLQLFGIIPDAEQILFKDVAYITTLQINYRNSTSTSLQGIEFFKSLEILECESPLLTSLDVSANTALKELYCRNNLFASLDVSANTALEVLNCDGGTLASLDVSANTALKELYCGDNQLTSLDVSGCTALEVLNCGGGTLASLDMSRNTALKELHCYNNQLTSLDVSGCTALGTLNCWDNQLASLDVSANRALLYLFCNNNRLTSLDVSANTALLRFSCDDNPGDGESKFPVTAWFDNETVPEGLDVDKLEWTYNGKTITVDYQKAE